LFVSSIFSEKENQLFKFLIGINENFRGSFKNFPVAKKSFVYPGRDAWQFTFG